ncbi:MAG: hypothetical protein KAH15_01100, partial [Candidatus Marinimicrobia bacterium]|nr:hypothetical protein [Candidatus Neomarinimicrobiota bacterium]
MFTLIPAFKYGWQEMHKKIWVFLLLTLLYSLADISNSYLMKDMIFTEDMNVMQFLEILPANFMQIISITSIALICLSFFVVTFVLAGLRGVQPLTYLRMKIKRFPMYVLAMILKMLAIGAGLLLFIVPGLFLLLAFYFMEFLIIDRDMPLLDAFRESWKMTKGFRTGIFFFEVNLFIIGYLLAFPQNLWPDTLMTYAIIALISVVWLPISWNAQGWIYQFVSENQINK